MIEVGRLLAPVVSSSTLTSSLMQINLFKLEILISQVSTASQALHWALYKMGCKFSSYREEIVSEGWGISPQAMKLIQEKAKTQTWVSLTHSSITLLGVMEKLKQTGHQTSVLPEGIFQDPICPHTLYTPGQRPCGRKVHNSKTESDLHSLTTAMTFYCY